MARRSPVRASARVADPQVPPAFRRVIAAFSSDSSVTLGRRFSSPCVLSARGKIFAMYPRGAFVAKLPRERVEELCESGQGIPWGPGTGRILKEWVAVPRHEESWPALAREARDFVAPTR